MRTLLAAFGIVAAAVLLASAAEPDTEAPTEYRIDLRVVKATDGDESTLAAPTIVTLEGRTAYFRTGGTLTPPPEADGAAPIEYGTSVLTIVKCHYGQPFIDAQFTETQPDLTNPDRVRISGFTVRVFEKVTFGKPIVVPVKDAKNIRCELTVSKFEPAAATAE